MIGFEKSFLRFTITHSSIAIVFVRFAITEHEINSSCFAGLSLAGAEAYNSPIVSMCDLACCTTLRARQVHARAGRMLTHCRSRMARACGAIIATRLARTPA